MAEEGFDVKLLGSMVLVVLAAALGLRAQEPPALTPPPAAAKKQRDYPPVPLATIAAGKWDRPRASITGTVTRVAHEDDGDWHYKVEDEKGHAVICELILEVPLPQPAVGEHPVVGDRITVWGIVRQDKRHGWWELHPVIGWHLAKPNAKAKD